MLNEAVYRDEEQAIRCARRIISSWVWYGVAAATDVLPVSMPNPLLEAVAGMVRDALADGRKGKDEFFGYWMDHQLPDEYRYELVDCVEYPPERPDSMARTVSFVLDYSKQLAIQRMTWSIQKAIDEGKDPSPLIRELAEIEAWETKPGGPDEGFRVIGADELAEEEGEARDFVEGLLTEGGFTVVYGPSNCGKSFWLLDLAAHIVSHPTWRNGEVEIDAGAVIYLALEGKDGVRNRLKALVKKGILTRPDLLRVCYEKVSLLEPGHAERLARTVAREAAALGVPVKMVVLDTMARAMAGGDENSSQDMTIAITAVDAVRSATDSNVVLSHHSGKDEARGARGHSSLRAAADTEIEITRPARSTISTVRVTKQRDLPMGEPMAFSLEEVLLGKNRRGKDIVSCVVKHEDARMAHKKQPGRKPIYSADQLLELLPVQSTRDFQLAAQQKLGMPRSVFYRLVAQIPKSKAMQLVDEKWVLVSVPQSPNSPEMDFRTVADSVS